MNKVNCKSCLYWKQVTNYEGPFNSGICKKLYDKITSDVIGDWHIKDIETYEDLFCSLFKIKD